MDISPSSSLDIHLSLSALALSPASSFASAASQPPPTATPTMSALDHASAASTTTVYFGYGSNLWRHQMFQRCPTSQCLGVARLRGYRWIIYDRGYANVVKITDDDDDGDGDDDNGDKDKASAFVTSSPTSSYDYTREVWGMVYRLQPEDEDRLDRNEGVPREYQKTLLECEFWATEKEKEGSDESNRNLDGITPQKVDMLVYVDHFRITPGDPKHEYIYRINMGVKDALKEGMPEDYVKEVVRKFVPDVEDERVAAFAQKQAVDFADENHSAAR